MMDLLDLDRRALVSTRRFLAGTTPAQLALPTPCAGWDVRALLDHVVGGNLLYAAAARGEPVDWSTRDGDRLGNDPHGAYDRSTDAVTAAFAAVEATATLDMPFGRLPVGQAVAVHFVDVLTHGWDLAVATGQHPELEDELANRALEIVAAYPDDAWGTPQFFAPKLSAPDDAPPYVRLVATLGRQP